MGLRLKSNKDSDVVSFKEMKAGDVGVIIDTDVKLNFNKLVMKLISGDVVRLGDGDYWSSDRGRDINVRLLPKGTEFIID